MKWKLCIPDQCHCWLSWVLPKLTFILNHPINKPGQLTRMLELESQAVIMFASRAAIDFLDDQCIKFSFMCIPNKLFFLADWGQWCSQKIMHTGVTAHSAKNILNIYTYIFWWTESYQSATYGTWGTTRAYPGLAMLLSILTQCIWIGVNSGKILELKRRTFPLGSALIQVLVLGICSIYDCHLSQSWHREIHFCQIMALIWNTCSLNNFRILYSPSRNDYQKLICMNHLCDVHAWQFYWRHYCSK